MQGGTVYGLLGDWIGWVCALLSLAGIGRALLVSARRGKHLRPLVDDVASHHKRPPERGKHQRRERRQH
jgi:hypothetical protein